MVNHLDDKACRLTFLADRLDDWLSDPRRIGVHKSYDGLTRAPVNPPTATMDAAAAERATKAGWYVSENDMVAALDAAKTLQMTLLDGTKIDRQIGQPFQNPYGPTGLTGPGVLGVNRTDQGPSPENRAVDAIPYFIANDGKLSFFGITRETDGKIVPAFNGGFNEGLAFKSVVKEFVEESITGSASVALEPLASLASPQVQKDIEGRKLLDAWGRAKGESTSTAADKDLLARYGVSPYLDKGEVIYQWLAKEKPDLIRDITELFQEDKIETYRGPVRADPRTTDTRWIATQVFASHVPEGKLDGVLKKYDLSLKGGSDAASANIHRFDADFVLNAYASHGPILMRSMAAILQKNPSLPKSVHDQAEDLINAVARFLCSPPQASLGVRRSTADLS